MENVENAIKKTLDLCHEKIANNVLLIESKIKFYKTIEYTKAKLPVNKVFDVSEMSLWEIQRPPTAPGVYIYEGMDKIDKNTANWLYGWALNGKTRGIRVAFVSESFPSAVTYSAQKILL